MNNFELTDEQTMILESVRGLVADVASQQALPRDEHREFVRESFDGFAELGLFGMLVSEDSGGAGLGYVALVVAVEEAANACGSSARLLMTQAGCCAAALDGLADGAELLEGVMAGETLCGYVGLDAGACADIDAGTVSGTAQFVTGGGEAGSFLVAAESQAGDLLCVVRAADAKVEAIDALGFRATSPTAVRFDGATATIIARGEEASAAIRRAELASLIGAAAFAAGSANGAIGHAKRHAGERIAFGKPLLGQQAVRLKLVESRRRAEAARHLAFHAARLADQGVDAHEAAMLAKITGVDACVHAADEAIQVHGGYGYTVEYHVERHYRDAKSLEVLDGGVDSLRDALAPS